MVSTIISSSLLMLLEFISLLKKYQLVGVFAIFCLFGVFFSYENINVHFQSLSAITSNVWTVLILYFHVVLFEFINNKKAFSFNIIILPSLMLFHGQVSLQISVLLALCFLDKKGSLDFIKFYLHAVGLALSLYMSYDPSVAEILGALIFFIYTVFFLYHFTVLKNFQEYNSNSLIYFILLALVILSLKEYLDPNLLKYTMYGCLVYVLCVVWLQKSHSVSIIPFSALLIMFTSIIFNLLELHHVLLIVAFMSVKLNKNLSLLKFKGENVLVKNVNAIKAILLVFFVTFLLKIINQNTELFLVTLGLFWFYLILILTAERKSQALCVSDAGLLLVLLCDVGGLLWLN